MEGVAHFVPLHVEVKFSIPQLLKPLSGGSHPLFKTVFEFEIDSNTNELNICVYCKGSTSRDDELVGFCTLKFKKVFFFWIHSAAHCISNSTAFRKSWWNCQHLVQVQDGRRQTDTTHLPLCAAHHHESLLTRLTDSHSLDWGYDCHEEDAPEAKSYRRTQSDPPRHQATYQNLPGTASENPQTTHCHHESYLNLPGTASYNDYETKPTFVRYGNPTRRRSESAQAPNHARPSPWTEYSNPIPAYKPRPESSYARPSPVTEYSKPIPAKGQPQVIIQPQVQMPVAQNQSVLVHLGGEMVGGLAEGIGGELANQLLGALCNSQGSHSGTQTYPACLRHLHRICVDKERS